MTAAMKSLGEKAREGTNLDLGDPEVKTIYAEDVLAEKKHKFSFSNGQCFNVQILGHCN